MIELFSTCYTALTIISQRYCSEVQRLTEDAEFARPLLGRDHLHVGLQVLDLNHRLIGVVRAGNGQLHVMAQQQLR